MPGSVAFQNQREFRCSHCSGKILVPKDLPPMTGPCPHCGTTITSPGPEDDKPPVQQVSAKVEVPAVVVKEKVEVPVEVPVVSAPVEPVRPAPAPPPLPPAPAPAPKQAPVEPVVERKPEPPLSKPEPVQAVQAPPVEPAPAPAPAPVVPREEPVREAAIPREVAPPPVPRREPEPVVAREVSTPVAPPPPREEIPVRPAAASYPHPPASPEKPAIPSTPAPAPPIEEVATRPVVAAAVPVVPPVQPAPASVAPAIPVAPAAQPVAVPVAPPAAAAPPVAEPSPEPAPAPAPPAPAPIPEVPQQAAPAQPAPVRISIGLTDEAMASVLRPEPAPAPEPELEPVPAAAPAPQPVPAHAHGPVAPSTPDVLPPHTKGKNANKSRKSILVPMLILLALILAGGVGVFIMTGKMGQVVGTKAPAADPAMQAKIRESQYSQTGWQDEARQVLGSFLAAESAAGKAAFSIRGSELLPQMNQFYGNSPIDDSDTLLAGFAAANLPSEDHKRGIFRMVYDQPPQFEMREFFRPLAPMEVQFGLQEPDILLSSLARASNFSSDPVKVEVFFKREPDGLKIDWETFVQTKYRTFRTFTELADPGRSGIFRLFVVEDVPERGRASQGTKTYRLADPAHKTDSVRVEVPVDSELGRSLSILNWRGVKDARPVTKTVTLELEWTKEASPRLAVKRFICWEFLGIGGQAVAASAPGGRK